MEPSQTPQLDEDDEEETEIWFTNGAKVLASQVFIKAWNLRELFLSMDIKRTGSVPVEQVVDKMLETGFPEPANPRTRPRLIRVVEKIIDLLENQRARRNDGPALAAMPITARMAHRARKASGDVSYNDMVSIFLGKVSPGKLRNMEEEKKDVEGEEDVGDEQRDRRVKQVLKNALRSARADRATFDQLYKSMDKDRDGWVSIDEVCQGLETMSIGSNFTKTNDFRSFVAKYSHINPGYLNADEYNAFMYLQPPSSCTAEALERDASQRAGARPNVARSTPIVLPECVSNEELLEVLVETIGESFMDTESAFKQFDANADGRVTIAEFFHALNDLGISVTQEQAKSMFEVFDLNAVGTLTLSEFVKSVSLIRKQMQFQRTNRRPSVAVASGVTTQLKTTLDPRASPNVADASLGFARPKSVASSILASSANFEFNDAALQTLIKAIKINPNTKARDMFKRIDRGNKNRIDRQDIVFAWEAANPSLPVPNDAIDALMSRLCASGEGDFGFAAFVRLLNAKSVDEL